MTATDAAPIHSFAVGQQVNTLRDGLLVGPYTIEEIFEDGSVYKTQGFDCVLKIREDEYVYAQFKHLDPYMPPVSTPVDSDLPFPVGDAELDAATETPAAPAVLPAATVISQPGAPMKAQTTKKALKAAVDQLARIIPTRSANPLLASLRIETTSVGLQLDGTNLEVDLRMVVPAELSLMGSPSRFIVPAHLFAQAVSKAGGDLIELELVGTALHIRSGGSQMKLQTGDVDAYPPLSFPACEFDLDTKEIVKSLHVTLYAVSDQTFQAVMRGVYWKNTASSADMVGSDGYRVAKRTLPPVGGLVKGNGAQGFIIPKRNAEHVLQILTMSDTARVHFGEGNISFQNAAAQLTVKLLAGDFPDYERVEPKNIVMSATLPLALLANALDRALLFTGTDVNYRLDCLISGGKLTLQAENEYGQFEEVLEIHHSGTAEALSTAVNSKLLLEALKAMSGDITLHLSGSQSPFIVTCQADPSIKAILVTLKGN